MKYTDIETLVAHGFNLHCVSMNLTILGSYLDVRTDFLDCFTNHDVL